MQVLKFGGTSVGSTANMEKMVEIVLKALKKDKTIVVSSAMSGVTDKLIETGKAAAESTTPEKYETMLSDIEERHISVINELLPEEYRPETIEIIRKLIKELKGICKGVFRLKELSFHTLDLIMSFGELLSTKILEAKFLSLGTGCKWIDSREVIKTYYAISQNIVDTQATNANIKKVLLKGNGRFYLLPGFIASDSTGRTTTLGRGGSDYTASLIAVGTGARILEIWTDVCGMMTADPRIVPEARTIENISYKEALELSHFGAKVVYPPTIQPVVSKGIPIFVKNTFLPESAGTLIENNPPESHNNIKGISSSNKLAILSMEGSGMVGIPGYSSRLFDVLTKNEINIILITQASSVHTMLVAIDETDAAKAKQAVDSLFAYEISLGKLEPLKVEKGFSIISLVGDDMKNQSGASGRMFEALGSEGINIRAIAQGSSEKNVSAVIATKDVNLALRAIHNEFFNERNHRINLFIAGYGNVGKELVKIIAQQRDILRKEKNIDLNIVGITNSRRRYISRSGISPEEINEILLSEKSTAAEASIRDFIDEAVHLHLPESIFVDCTSDRGIAGLYPEILRESIGIVTCNKIANSSSMELYAKIREAALKGKVSFIYDTNVGASLPVLRTIRQMVSSGDKVRRVEAMVSGSLNFIFSEYCSDDFCGTFASVVERARKEGYTEPDPRTDLSGVDVLRKGIIIARECGISIEASDVLTEGFLPADCLEGDVEQFFTALERNEEVFAKMREHALKEVGKLRYLAVIEDGKVSIGLKLIGKDHPFYRAVGTDAAVAISSDFYPAPVIISGAGAGGKITAAGVFNGIIKN